MPKVQPPELKGFMDKKLSSELLVIFPLRLPTLYGAPHSARKRSCSAATVFRGSTDVNVLLHRVVKGGPAPWPLRHPPTFVTEGCPWPSAVALNANRHVTGTLRGFDQFMNLVLDNTVDDKTKSDIGMVVRARLYP